MRVLGALLGAGDALADEKYRPSASAGFHWAMAALCAWIVGGVYWDGWAHNHFGTGLETFFTVWHLSFYSGFAALSLLTLATAARNHREGYPWLRAVPAGYGLTLVGEAVFFFGGAADMAWHELFGIEADVEALLSPTHLLLGLGLALMVGGPLRAAWRRADPRSLGWAAQAPMVLSAAFVLSTITFFTQFAHPIERPWPLADNEPTAASLPLVSPNPNLIVIAGGSPGADLVQSASIAGILLQTGVLMGLILLLVRRWGHRLVPGTFTVLFAINAALIGLMRDELTLVPAFVAAGLAVDALLKALEPSAGRPGAFRAFSFAVPVVLYGAYFIELELMGGVWWSIHLWAGAIAMAGIAGWLSSYAFVPPAVPAEERLGPDTDSSRAPRVSREEEEEYAQRSPG